MKTIKRLVKEDFEVIATFIKQQISTMPREWFYPPNREILKKCLNTETGISHGAFIDDVLVGIRLSYKPGLGQENHGYSLEYTKEQLLNVYQFHGTLIINENRYKGLGHSLVIENTQAIFSNGGNSILATVHPENRVSIKMLEKNGFIERKRMLKYEN